MRFREKQFSVQHEQLHTSISRLEIFTVLELFSDALYKMERLFNNLHITAIRRPSCMLEEARLKAKRHGKRKFWASSNRNVSLF